MKPVLSSVKEYQKKNLKKGLNQFEFNVKTPKKNSSRKSSKKSLDQMTDSSDSSFQFDNYEDDTFETPLTSKADKNFVYKVNRDNDLTENYGKYPKDDVTVYGSKTSIVTGKKTPMVMSFKNLPIDAKKKWSEERKKKLARETARDSNRTFRTLHLDAEFDEDSDDDNRTLKGSSSSDEGSSRPGAAQFDGDYSISNTKGKRKGTNRGLLPAPKTSSRTGKGLKKNSKLIDFDFIPYEKNNRIIFEYFDDANELCERLKLLISSRMAGNTNHMHEIASIIEELRELDLIE